MGLLILLIVVVSIIFYVMPSMPETFKRILIAIVCLFALVLLLQFLGINLGVILSGCGQRTTKTAVKNNGCVCVCESAYGCICDFANCHPQ